jgi:hypothetical protein
MKDTRTQTQVLDEDRAPTGTDPVAGHVAAVGRGSLAAAGIAGLTYFLSSSGSFPDGPQMSTATAQEIRDHVTASGGAIQGPAFAGMVGIAAALIFVPALARQVRDRLPNSLLADAVLGAGLLVIIYQWLVVVAESLLRFLPDLLDSTDLAQVSDERVQGWYGLIGFTHYMGDLALVPMMMLVGAFSIAALKGKLLPTWQGWLGLVIAAAGAVGMVSILGVIDALYPLWFAGLIGYVIWVLVISITFLIRMRRDGKSALDQGER